MAREINAARLSNAPAAHEMNTCGIREMQHKCCVVAEIIKLCVLHFASEINTISLVISTERQRAEKSRSAIVRHYRSEMFRLRST